MTTVTLRPGLPTADRAALRQHYRDRALAHADRTARSLVCVQGNCGRCRGEEPGNPGCLCECHG